MFVLFEREKERTFSLLVQSSNDLELGLDQVATRSQERLVDVPHGRLEPIYLSHHLLPPRVCRSWKLESRRQELQLLAIGCQHPKQWLTHCARHLPQDTAVFLFLS